MLDANTQIGNRFSETKVNLFEWHGQTAGWGFGLLSGVAILVALTAYACHRRYKRKLKRHAQRQLAITWEGGRRHPPAIAYEGGRRPPAYDLEEGRRNSLDRP